MSATTPPATRLAGDIAAQFRHIPDAEAAATVAHHIRMFWEPRMQTQLREQIASGVEADPLVIAAVAVLDS